VYTDTVQYNQAFDVNIKILILLQNDDWSEFQDDLSTYIEAWMIFLCDNIYRIITPKNWKRGKLGSLISRYNENYQNLQWHLFTTSWTITLNLAKVVKSLWATTLHIIWVQCITSIMFYFLYAFNPDMAFKTLNMLGPKIHHVGALCHPTKIHWKTSLGKLID